MARIRRLAPLVQSQIAAGEVVLGPASVVKELVENSLDAGATRISVDFSDSGLELIRVSDDGVGMEAEDAVLALERFATSKLQESEDIYSIATLGFRGEALPSISSVSRMRVETRAASEDAGIRVLAVGGEARKTEEAGLPLGTTVTVENLFFNTPARLKFLRARSGERQAIVETVMRLALAWPNVAFTLRSGNNTVFQTAGQGLQNALSDVFGPSDASSMVPVDGAGGIVKGFVGLPSLYRRSRDRQMFSVNSRPVKNSMLGWALDEAYAGLLPPKAYAFAVIDVAVPASDVDVNVHPTKAEVKFRNERELRSKVIAAVSSALSEAGYSLAVPEGEAERRHGLAGPIGHIPGLGDCPRRDNWGGTGPSIPGRDLFGGSGDGRRTELIDTSGGVNWEVVRDAPAYAAEPLGETDWEYLGSLNDTYLVVKAPSSRVLVDKHALMESLTYAALISGKGGRQELLVSEMVRLDPQEALAYEDSEEILAEVGFTSRLVGDRTVMVTAVPTVMGRAIPPQALREVLAKIGEGGTVDPVRTLSAARLETAACHASVRAREKLTAEEARALIYDLRKNPDARTCPHGRPTIKEITLEDMDKFFGRA